MRHPLVLVAVVLAFAPGARAQSSTSSAAPDTASAHSTEGCELVVLNPVGRGLSETEAHLPALLADSIAAELGQLTGCRVITQNDIQSLLNFEAERAACGADADSSCAAEISNALGVSRVVTGSVGRLGSSFKLQLVLQDVAAARIIKRSDRVVSGTAVELDREARSAARELFVDVSDAQAQSSDGDNTLLIAGGSVAAIGVAMLVAGGAGLAWALTGSVVPAVRLGMHDAVQPVALGGAIAAAAGAAAAAVGLGVVGAAVVGE